MDLKEAKQLVGGVGTRAWLMTMGVIFPGLLIACELIWLYLLWNPPGQPILPFVLEKFGDPKPLIGFFLVVLSLAVSCAVGYINRDVSFAISNFWLRQGWPARSLRSVLDELRYVYGTTKVDNVIKDYGVFSLVNSKQDPVRTLPRSPEFYVREFCKLWLADKRPSLSTEGVEIEINVVIGLVIPLTLASVVFFASLRGLLGFLFAAASLLSAGFLLYRINVTRVMETENAIVNFLFAHWEDGPKNISGSPSLGSERPTD